MLSLLQFALGCDSPESSGSSARPGDVVGGREAVTSVRDAVDATKSASHSLATPALAPPRTPSHLDLERIWESSRSLADSVLMHPVDLQQSDLGLLVFDLGGPAIRVFAFAPELRVQSHGRAGSGPGDLSVSSWFMGSREHPAALDRTLRKVNRLRYLPDSIASTPIPSGRFTSGCTLPGDVTFAYRVVSSLEFFRGESTPSGPPLQYDFMTFEGDRVLDSFPAPWPELRRLAPIVRQTVVRQLDDSTCVLLPPYQGVLATVDARSRFVAARTIESTRIVEPEVSRAEDGRITRISLPRTARLGSLDARGWRDRVLVLHNGRDALAGRLLDVYRRADLAYEGTLVLPDRASRIAIAGDTLAVLAEREDLPLLQLFRLGGPRQ